MQKIKGIVFDTETTGLTNPEIVEAAYLALRDDFTVHDQYEERFLPPVPIEVGAMATHNIIPEDLVNCRMSEEFVFPDTEYVVGHNIDYDLNEKWFEGRTVPKRICTLALARYAYPDISHKQAAVLYHILNSNVHARDLVANAHSALVDVQVCHLILQHFIKMYEIKTWEELYDLSELARIPKVMTFGKHKGEKLEDVPKSYLQWYMKQDEKDPYLEKAIRGIL